MGASEWIPFLSGATVITKTKTSINAIKCTFDFSDVPNYQNLTIDNFAIKICKAKASLAGYEIWAYCSEYNNSSGVLTFTTASSVYTLSEVSVICFY